MLTQAENIVKGFLREPGSQGTPRGVFFPCGTVRRTAAQSGKGGLDERAWRSMKRFTRGGFAVKSGIKTGIWNFGYDLLVLLKWIAVGLVMGAVVGAATSGFGYLIQVATDFRLANGWIIWLLPLAGLLIVFLYKVLEGGNDLGTNAVIEAVRSQKKVPAVQGLLIVVSTVLTHLFGGSTGREGAALQLGGSIGSVASRGLRLKQGSSTILVMAGMSAAFSALFGTPLAAVVLPIEFVSVGVMYYAALVPCVVSSFTAHAVAVAFGIHENHITPYAVADVPELYSPNFLKVVVVGIACAAVGIFFCRFLHFSHGFLEKILPNPYIRIAASGLAVAVLTFILGTQDYNGLGSSMIRAAFDGNAPWYAFLLKILFTALTLGAGFKGGEIVPSFFVGATVGCLLSGVLGLPAALCSACGMCGVFCAITNSPISALMISFELFGFTGVGYYAVVIGISYMLSDYVSVFSAQKILYSKTEPKYIDRLSADAYATENADSKR